MMYIELDLSTADFPGGYAVYSDGAIRSSDGSSWPNFRWLDLELDPNTEYEFQVDYEPGSYAALYIYSQLTNNDSENSYWYTLGEKEQSGATQLTLTIGPNRGDWSLAHAAGENHVLFSADPSSVITGMRYSATPYVPPPAPSNDNFADAMAITDWYGSAPTPAVNNTSATKEPGEPASTWEDRSAWYKFTPDFAGRMLIALTNETGAYRSLYAYTGTAIDALTNVGGSSSWGGNPSFYLDVTAGTTYHLQAMAEGGTDPSDYIVLLTGYTVDTTYSEWVQDADFVKSIPSSTFQAAPGQINPDTGEPLAGVRNTFAHEEFHDPSTNSPPASKEYLDGVIAAVNNGTAEWRNSQSSTGPSQSGLVKGDIDRMGGAVSNDGTNYAAERSFTPTSLSAWHFNSNLYTAPSAPDAKGVEYSHPHQCAAVIKAELALSVANNSLDETTGVANSPVAGNWKTKIQAFATGTFGWFEGLHHSYGGRTGSKAALVDWDSSADLVGGVTLFELDPPASTDANFNTPQPMGVVDVTHLLQGDGTDGCLVLMPVLDPSPTIELASYDYDELGFVFGATLSSLEMTYTLRPPTYRYIYETLVPVTAPVVTIGHVPPLRMFPRDDARGMASSSRIFPRPSSTQGSNRIGSAGSYD